MPKQNEVNILLIEDDDIHAEAFARTIKKCDLTYNLKITDNALEAFNILRIPKIPNPYIIFLDLNLPSISGFEFLKELREDPLLKESIVFIITTSDDEKDIETAYEYNVAGYVNKAELAQKKELLPKLINSYSRLNKFPPLPKE